MVLKVHSNILKFYGSMIKVGYEEEILYEECGKILEQVAQKSLGFV